MNKKELNVKIEMFDRLNNYREEDIAKNCLPFLTPFLTRRHGINKGLLSLEDGSVIISWEYLDIGDYDYQPEDQPEFVYDEYERMKDF